MHKISDIINAIICNGLEIEKFDEYNMEMANNAEVKNVEKFPIVDTLRQQLSWSHYRSLIRVENPKAREI